MRTLRELLATWETWNSRAMWSRIIATTDSDHHRDVAQSALDETPEFDSLDVLRDVTELVTLLHGGQWLITYDARVAGASWTEIGQATRQTGEEAQATYVRAIEVQEQHGITLTSAYREVI